MRKILIIPLLLIAFNVKAQSINEFYTIASDNNPELKAKYKEFEASLQKVAQVSTLPDPSLTMEYLVSPSSPENMRLTLSQMFPWFGTLKAQLQGEIMQRVRPYERGDELMRSAENIYEVIDRQIKIFDTYSEASKSRKNMGF